MKLAFPPTSLHTLAICDREERFPVGRIFCVGRNYAAHAREMGGDERDPPFFFMKPNTATVDASQAVELPYPSMTRDYQHEIELVVTLSEGGSNLSPSDALARVHGYAVGLDMTRRDLQTLAKAKGRPWEFSKSFAASAPISAISPVSDVGHLNRGRIELEVNGQLRQASDLSAMTWSVAECIAELSRYEALKPGDLIMTGTPEGVAAVVSGDQLIGRIENLTPLDVRIR